MALPVELQSELELSRIVSCRWLPGQAGGARRGIAQLVHCGDVGVVGKVESIGDQVEVESFAEVDGLGDAQVELEEKWHDEFVPSQVANASSGRGNTRNSEWTAIVREAGLRDAERGAVNVWRSGGPAGRRPILGSAEIKPRVGPGDHVEGPARRQLDQRSDREIAQQSVHESFAMRVRRSLEDATGDPAMALIVYRVGTLEKREARILRLERGLQVGGVVNGMRPGVTGKQFKVVGKVFGDIDGQSVVPGTARRFLRVDAVEGNGHAKAGGKSRRRSKSHLRGVATGNKARKRWIRAGWAEVVKECGSADQADWSTGAVLPGVAQAQYAGS